MYPDSHTALNFSSPLEMLVATILSAQCTDERVNEETGHIFQRFPTARDYAEASLEELEEEFSSINFFRQKARSVNMMARRLVDDYGGKVPDTMDELVTLHGVARKTANVVLHNAFDKNEGIAVDTHVKRLAGRLGLSRETDPNRIERDLMELYPREKWGTVTHVLIDHGRAVCKARKPLCSNCVLAKSCPSSLEPTASTG